MLHNHRVWLFAAGLWLTLGGMIHLGLHLWHVVGEHAMVGYREFTMSAMRQALWPDPLQPTAWRVFRALSLSTGLLLVFAGVVDLLLAWTDAPPRVVRAVALAATVFWTLAFAPYAFVDPVALLLVVAAVSVPLHGLAWLTADQACRL